MRESTRLLFDRRSIDASRRDLRESEGEEIAKLITTVRRDYIFYCRDIIDTA